MKISEINRTPKKWQILEKKGGGLEKLSCPQVPMSCMLQDSKTFIAQGLLLISLALKKNSSSISILICPSFCKGFNKSVGVCMLKKKGIDSKPWHH